MIQKIIVLTKRQKNWDYLILNDWFHLLLRPATVSRRCHRAYIFYDLFTWVLPQLEIQEKHFFLSLSLCDVNKRHSLERLRYRRTQTMCDFIGGICGGTHSDNIQIFFFFFRGGDMSSFSGLALIATQQKSAHLGVKEQTRAAARGDLVVHTWLQPLWPPCWVQTWRSARFSVITPNYPSRYTVK